MTHFLAIDHDIESDRVLGVYDSLREATTDLDNRTIDKKLIEAEAWRNRQTQGPGAGPYSDDYGCDRAVVEEWEGRRHVATWEPGWDGKRKWRVTWAPAQSIQK